MWDMDLSILKTLMGVLTFFFLLVGCTSKPPSEAPFTPPLFHSWELQPGDSVAGHPVVGSLGDLSIDLKGKAVVAPYDGRLQPNKGDCVIFSSPDVPNYLLRLCGLSKPRLGQRQTGDILGVADTLQLAVLNKRPDGLWAFVEPSKTILQQLVQSP